MSKDLYKEAAEMLLSLKKENESLLLKIASLQQEVETFKKKEEQFFLTEKLAFSSLKGGLVSVENFENFFKELKSKSYDDLLMEKKAFEYIKSNTVFNTFKLANDSNEVDSETDPAKRFLNFITS